MLICMLFTVGDKDMFYCLFFVSSKGGHTSCALVTGVQTCALPICLAARLVARRYVRNRTGEMNDAIRLEIELKGLGSAGPDTESRLRRAILGYYREDLYLVPPPEVRGDDDDDSPYDSP